MNAPAQSLGVVLPEVIAFIRRFVVLGSSEELDTLALWVAHTHAFEAADATPYLAITSPKKGCGKTQLLEVLSVITPRSWKIDGVPTEAVLFRKIERDEPTIFLDEADRLFRSGAERVEPLVALLNAGNRRGAKVPRCVSQGNDLRDFSVFCPKALSGIDHARWPETIRDRAIVIQLHRRTAGEPVERFRLRLVERDAQPVYTRLATAVDAVADRLGDAEPDDLPQLTPRAFAGWEPLLALADAAGDDWPERARRAALALSGVRPWEGFQIASKLAESRRLFPIPPQANPPA